MALQGMGERPNYYIAATYRYKYQAVKAFQAAHAVLKGDSTLHAWFIHDLVSGVLYGSTWFVVILGVLPSPDREQALTEVLRAKGTLILLDAALLHDLLQEAAGGTSEEKG